MTILFLLTFGPFTSVFALYKLQWGEFVFSISIFSLFISLFYYKRHNLRRETNLLFVLCFLYAVFVLINFFMHRIAMSSVADTLILNVSGLRVMSGQQDNVKFTIYYLFFPALFLLQYIMLRKIDLKILISSLAFVMTGSLLVLFYQFFVDINFLNHLYWVELRRVGGLSDDPNSFAMTAFLLIPLFVNGILLETKKKTKAFYLILIFSLITGIYLTANRTSFAGIILLTVSLPIVFAMSHTQLSGKKRLVLLISPFVLLIGIYLLLPVFLNIIEPGIGGELFKRIVSTWHKFHEGGLTSVFFNEERRGEIYSIAWKLFLNAPLSGWGPGGFIREYPNMHFIQLGWSRIPYDIVLNHYLMIASELGIVVLILNLILIISPLIIAYFTLKKLSDFNARLGVAIILVANIIFLIMINTIPPSIFPDLIWVWTAQLAYLIIYGEKNNIFFAIKFKK